MASSIPITRGSVPIGARSITRDETGWFMVAENSNLDRTDRGSTLNDTPSSDTLYIQIIFWAQYQDLQVSLSDSRPHPGRRAC